MKTYKGIVYTVSGNTHTPFANGSIDLTADSRLSISTNGDGEFTLQTAQAWSNGETDKIIVVTEVTND